MDHTVRHGSAAAVAARHRPRPWAAALLMLGLIAAFFLLREHWGHIAGAWPYLLLLACPLMHLFHGHGGQGGQAKSGTLPGHQ